MKYLIFFVVLAFVSLKPHNSQAQKFGYIDTEYITSKMPEYKNAQVEMDKFSEKWVKDVQAKYTEIDKLKQQYQAEEILLTDDMKRERQKAITDKEQTTQELNNKVFGFEGQLFQKKKELMKPIQDEIYRIVEKVARQKQLMFIFDKSADMTMLYTDPRHDYTDYVLEGLGLDDKKKK